jgi:hypothetical protein
MKKKYSFPSGGDDLSLNDEGEYEHVPQMVNNAYSKSKFSFRARTVAVAALLLFTASFATAVTVTVTSNTLWSTITTGSGPGGQPNSTDDIIVRSNATLTVNVANGACKSITLGVAGSNNNGNLTFNTGSQITVSGIVAFGNHGNRTNTITMTSGGRLLCQSFTIGTTGINSFVPGTGTVEMTANNTLPSTIVTSFNNLVISGGTTLLAANLTIAGNLYIATGATLTLGTFTANRTTMGGTLTVSGTLLVGGANNFPSNFSAFASAGGKVNFNGTINQTIPAITFYNLIASGSGTKIIAAGSAVTVSNNLTTGGLLTIESTSTTNSGSLIVNGSSIGNVTYDRLMPGSLYRYIASPVSNASLPSGQTYWRYDEPTGNWIETTSCMSGLGYTILTSGNTVSFTGSLVNSASQTGTAPYTTPYTQDRDGWGGGGWNLLGNPFTCSLDGPLFISANAASMDASYQAIYIYNGTDYYYIATSTPGYPGLGSFSGTDVQAGQGFFVLAHHNSVPFSFTGSMRKHNTSAVMTKSASVENVWPGLQLKVKYRDKESSTLIVYNENMTAGLDSGYDIGLLSSGSDVEIYTALAAKDNDVNFARQALPLKDCINIIVPIGIDSENGGEVTFSAFTVPLENYTFYLEDTATGISTDLSTKSYTVTLPEKTYGTGRFFIIASANTPTGIEKTQSDDPGVRIWTSNDQVIFRGEVSDKAFCEIYNVNGKKILDKRLSGGELNTITIPSGLKGVFIVRVSDGVKVTARKVALL